MDGCMAFPVINLRKTGRNIERLRKEAGVTVRDLQTYFGFEYPQAIYKWQKGACLPSVDNLLALAMLLKVPMEDLLVCDGREAALFLVLNHRFNDIGAVVRYNTDYRQEHSFPRRSQAENRLQ